MGECSGDEAGFCVVGGVCVCSRWDRRDIQVQINPQSRCLGDHQSDIALDAIVKGCALEVERVQDVGLRKLPSVGLTVLGGFLSCL